MLGKRDKEMKERLLRERETILRQREALDGEIRGLERAIALYVEDNEKPPATKRQPIKALILNILEDIGTTGLNATTVVTLANARGVTVERASVSSLLSRLKADGIVEFDGSLYRLPKYAKSGVTEDPFNVSHLHPAS